MLLEYKIGLALLVLLIIGLVILVVWCKPAREIAYWIWRLLTGGLVARKPDRWDSTFSKAAPERSPDDERMMQRGVVVPRSWWGRWPGWKRMAARWGGTAYVVAFLLQPLPVAVLTGVVVIVAAVRRVAREVHDRLHGKVTEHWVELAGNTLGWSRGTDPLTWIAIPRPRLMWNRIAMPERVTLMARHLGEWAEHAVANLAYPSLRVPLDDDDAKVVVHYPATSAVDRLASEIANVIKARLPLGPWDYSHSNGAMTITFRHPKRPPSQVTYDEEAFQQYSVTEIPIGKDANGWRVIPVKKLTPHTIISATTGWCKTTLLNVIIAHTAGNGARVLINDPKRVGFLHLRDLPNIEVRTSIEGQIDLIDEFLREMLARYEWIERFPEIKENPELYFQPWFYVEDEKGSLMSDIKDWWKAQGEKGVPLPFRKIKKILWQARAAGMYAVSAAQQAGVDVFIDSDGRDQYMARIASGPQTMVAYRLMFSGSRKRVSTKKGRALFALGVDEPSELQLAMISDDETRNYAQSGMVIAERENEARRERLQKLVDAEKAAGADGPTGVTGPGEMPANDPVNDQTTGAEGHSSTVDLRKSRSVFDGELIDTDGDRHGDGLSLVKPRQGDDAERPATVSEGESASVIELPTQPATELVVGIPAGAAFLGMTEAAFVSARKRTPGGIRGEVKVGASPAWPTLALKEWQTQRPRAGAS
jgi:hypothetical protein